MRAVSAAFKEAHARPTVEAIREIYMKRRFWSQSTNTYGWESSWTQIPESEVESISAIIAQLDTQQLNEFKVSNVTLQLRNERNQWKADNRSGKFGQDSASPLYGYEPYWTKFQIKTGFKLADGTTETVSVFTGLAVEFGADSQRGTVLITVQGQESLLMNSDAENVSTRVVEEVPSGTVNGVNKDFTTANPGAGIIEEVSLDGITLRAGIDYTVSQQNETSLGAKISFAVAPAIGQIPRVTYRYWFQNKKVEELIALLLTEAGVAGANQVIDPVIFPTPAAVIVTQEKQVQFAAGTVNKKTINDVPGAIVLDYTEDTFKQLLDNFTAGSLDAAWTVQHGSGTISGGRLYLESTGVFPFKGNVSRISTKSTGVWSIDFQYDTGGSSADFWFMSDRPTAVGANGYRIEINRTIPNIRLDRVTGGVGTALGYSTFTGPTSSHTLKVSRTPWGRIRIYFDGSKVIDVVDTTYVSSQYLQIFADGKWYFDNVYGPADTISGDFVCQTLDLGASLNNFGKLITNHNAGGGAILFYTRTSTDGISFDSWTEVADNYQIRSAVKRYMQVKPASSAGTVGNPNPIIYSFSVEYKTTSSATSTVVTLGNFTDMTVYEAVQELGKFSGYEWGFKADESFFFRSKSVDKNIDQELRWDTNIEGDGISNIVNGYDNVYSEVKATYGSFSHTVKDSGLSSSGPAARFKKKRLEVDGGNVLISSDVDIAKGMAAYVFARVNRPRRRMTVKVKFMPWLDLADTVSVTFRNDLPQRPFHLGDTSVYLGQSDLQLHGSGHQIADGFLAKVIASRLLVEPEQYSSEFEIEEILQ